MDPVITAVDVEMVRSHGANVDDVLVEPELREEFLSNSRRVLGSEVGESWCYVGCKTCASDRSCRDRATSWPHG